MDDRFLSTTWKETVIKEEEISKKNPNNYTESQYKTAKSIYNKHCTELKRTYYHQLIHDQNGNSTAIWKIINELLKRKQKDTGDFIAVKKGP